MHVCSIVVHVALPGTGLSHILPLRASAPYQGRAPLHSLLPGGQGIDPLQRRVSHGYQQLAPQPSPKPQAPFTTAAELAYTGYSAVSAAAPLQALQPAHASSMLQTAMQPCMTSDDTGAAWQEPAWRLPEQPAVRTSSTERAHRAPRQAAEAAGSMIAAGHPAQARLPLSVSLPVEAQLESTAAASCSATETAAVDLPGPHLVAQPDTPAASAAQLLLASAAAAESGRASSGWSGETEASARASERAERARGAAQNVHFLEVLQQEMQQQQQTVWGNPLVTVSLPHGAAPAAAGSLGAEAQLQALQPSMRLIDPDELTLGALIGEGGFGKVGEGNAASWQFHACICTAPVVCTSHLSNRLGATPSRTGA
jgi:hypothetical protein